MARRRAPDVVSGARGPENFPERREDEAPAALPQIRKKEGERVFQAKYPNLRVQIRTEPDTFVGGRNYPGRNVAAQFENGVFRTSDPEIIRVLEDGRNYGIGHDYWDAEEMLAQAKAAEKKQAREAILAHKEVIRELAKDGLLSKSDLEDFAMEAGA